MYMCSLASVFCSRHISVKQLKFEMYIILCQYSYHGFLYISKNKLKHVKLSEINISSSYGNDLKRCEVWKIYHIDYGSSLATDWLKTKGSWLVILGVCVPLVMLLAVYIA